MAKTRGKFTGVSGVATIAERPEDSTLEVEIDTTTVDTGDATRDGHLRSNDFFGVEDHPAISFRSTGIRPGAGETERKVEGDLTIRGVTRPVTVDVEFLGGAIDPWGKLRIGFSTGGFLLAKNVRLEIEAELVRK